MDVVLGNPHAAATTAAVGSAVEAGGSRGGDN